MNHILEDIYKRLAFEHETYIPEYLFSKDYLGRNRSYFSYLKSSGKSVSASSLIFLWTKLNTQKNVFQDAYNRAVKNGEKSSWRTLAMQERYELYQDLSDRAYQAITTYHQ